MAFEHTRLIAEKLKKNADFDTKHFSMHADMDYQRRWSQLQRHSLFAHAALDRLRVSERNMPPMSLDQSQTTSTAQIKQMYTEADLGPRGKAPKYFNPKLF